MRCFRGRASKELIGLDLGGNSKEKVEGERWNCQAGSHISIASEILNSVQSKGNGSRSELAEIHRK
jgi:hypothetical protein